MLSYRLVLMLRADVQSVPSCWDEPVRNFLIVQVLISCLVSSVEVACRSLPHMQMSGHDDDCNSRKFVVDSDALGYKVALEYLPASAILAEARGSTS